MLRDYQLIVHETVAIVYYVKASSLAEAKRLWEEIPGDELGGVEEESLNCELAFIIDDNGISHEAISIDEED